MKESLLAPFKPLKPSGNSGQGSRATDMENKYKGTFGFGTPTIRPSKKMRDKGLSQEQIRSQLTLHKLAGSMMAGGQSNQDEERDSNNFKKSKASDFFKRTRAAEIELKNKHMKEQSEPSSNTIFQKFDEINEKKGSVKKKGLFDLE